MFGAYLVDRGIQSSTLKSYVSALKCILTNDGYEWDNNKVLLHSLMSSCKIVNDTIKTRFPIKIGLLELLLFETQCKFHKQPYLEIMYKAVLALGYYGLLRVGELAQGPHVIRACDIHMLVEIRIKSSCCCTCLRHTDLRHPQPGGENFGNIKIHVF